MKTIKQFGLGQRIMRTCLLSVVFMVAVLLLAGDPPVHARTIAVNGDLDDWCFPSATLGVNTRSTLTSLTVPCTGARVQR